MFNQLTLFKERKWERLDLFWQIRGFFFFSTGHPFKNYCDIFGHLIQLQLHTFTLRYFIETIMLSPKRMVMHRLRVLYYYVCVHAYVCAFGKTEIVNMNLFFLTSLTPFLECACHISPPILIAIASCLIFYLEWKCDWIILSFNFKLLLVDYNITL